MRGRLAFFLLVLILAGVYWQWFLPGPKVASDFSITYDDFLKSMVDFPRTWTEKGAEGLGEYTAFFGWSYPLSFISGIFGFLGLSFDILERVILLIPFLFLGTLGIWKLCESFKLSNLAKFIACLFYLTNTYIILLLDGGQLPIGLAYGLFPISFLAIEKSVKEGLSKKILAGLLVAVLGFFDFRFILLLFLLGVLRFFYEFIYLNKEQWLDWTLNWIKSGITFGLIVLGLHVYWLYPLSQAPILPTTYAFFTQTSFLNLGNLGHSILMLAPHWYKNIFGNITELRFEFILIPILIFIAPILRPKNRVVGFWMIVALISVFLTKGASEPYPQVYPWLFFNIPGFSLFRDSSKFFFLLSLSYSILLAITSDEIITRLKKFSKLRVAFLFSLTLYLIFLIRPVWLADMIGTFSQPPLQKEYSQLANFLENDKTFSRVFWIPTLAPLGYSSSKHPRVEAARLVQKRPFAIGTLGTYEIFNFLREASFMGEIFDVSGIGYLVYPVLDPRRDNLHPDNIKYYDIFSDQLSKLPWLSKVENSPVPLWKTQKHQDKFFIAPNVWWVVGSDKIYHEATKSSQLSLSKNALIFVDQHPGLGTTIDQLPESKIVLNNKTLLDLAASFISASDLIFPAKKLGFSPDKSGWWKREAADLIRWRDFLQTKYGIDNLDFDLGGGWAVGEGNRQLTINNGQLKKGKILLARVLESTRSGELNFNQDGQKVGKILTKKEGNNVRWFEVGLLPKDGEELEIRSVGDINVVNAVASLDKNEWEKSKNRAEELQNKIYKFDEKTVQDTVAEVTYQQINPTKYKVFIKNLTQPSFLVFSQSYHSLWKMNGQESLPVYSLLNGFRVEKDGQYLVEFEVQKYVLPGLTISLLSLFIIISLLLHQRQKRSSIIN